MSTHITLKASKSCKTMCSEGERKENEQVCFVPGHGKEMWKGKDRKEGKEGQSGEEKETMPKEGKTI